MTTLASGVLLALAWFAAVNAAVSLVAWTIGEVLLAGLEAQAVTKRRLPLRHHGRPALILSVRLLPAAASLLLVGVWFLPAHWRFEPRDSSESFGIVLSALAVVGAALLVRSGARALRVARADRVLRAAGLLSPIDVAHHAGEVYEVPGLAGVSLAGVRPSDRAQHKRFCHDLLLRSSRHCCGRVVWIAFCDPHASRPRRPPCLVDAS